MTHVKGARLIGALGSAWLLGAGFAHAQTFTIRQILSAPFAADIVAASDAPRFAWVSNKAGARNVWLAQPQNSHGFGSTPLTHYMADDGQEISDLAFVPHHDQLLFVRGGDIEYPDKAAPNPAALSAGVAQEIYLCDLKSGALRKIAEGHAPLASPDGNTLLYLHAGNVYRLPQRSEDKPEPLFKLRGAVSAISFAPQGDALAFVSDRGDHSFIGIYRFADKSIRWLDPSLSLDSAPRWSQDGAQIAFLRTPSIHDDVEIISHRTGAPWSIRVAALSDGGSREVYRAARGDGSVFHALSSLEQLQWSGESLVFPSERDGWLHLYSVPAAGGTARLLTPGAFEIEYAAASPDGRMLIYAANAGDTDRRHLWRLDVASGKSEPLTPGSGIETQPVVLSDNESVAFLRADVKSPAHAALLTRNGPIVDFPAEGLPGDFPGRLLIEPKSVQLPERAGIAAHGMLFVPTGAAASHRHPALIFMHGGPVRQMLAGWHYMDYYSNAYAMNQYLASRGFVVLSLNYRAGIGYGLGFREAERVGAAGASEYNDVLAAAEYLKSRGDVDATRLGLWGGSYGGYLTALGLARNSDIFKAGVDLHGVHDWHHWTLGERDDHPLYVLDTPPDQLATALAASPVAMVGNWRSPVLLIQGDDDHNVPFSETVRLAEALRAQGVDYSELVFPDEIHGFLRHDSWVRAYTATAEFLERHLSP